MVGQVAITGLPRSFCPQTGETAPIEVTASRFLVGDPNSTLSVSVVRELKNAADEVVADLDLDPDAPGVQTPIPADFARMTIIWDGKPTVSRPQGEGRDCFQGLNGSMLYRRLPAVNAAEGYKVPPPKYEVVGRMTLPGGATYETRRTLRVPQVYGITWSDEALAAVKIDTRISDTGPVVVEGCKDDDGVRALENTMIPFLTSAFVGVNVRFVARTPVGNPGSTVRIEMADPQMRLGASPNDLGNVCPTDTCRVFLQTILAEIKRRYIEAGWVPPSWFDAPVTPAQLSVALGIVATHEVGHSLGLVRRPYLDAISDANNHNRNANGMNFMDEKPDTETKEGMFRFLGRAGSLSFRTPNAKYLEWVLEP